jgi:hypothetical protein
MKRADYSVPPVEHLSQIHSKSGNYLRRLAFALASSFLYDSAYGWT